jgi:hypothetical protein
MARGLQMFRRLVQVPVLGGKLAEQVCAPRLCGGKAEGLQVFEGAVVAQDRLADMVLTGRVQIGDKALKGEWPGLIHLLRLNRTPEHIPRHHAVLKSGPIGTYPDESRSQVVETVNLIIPNGGLQRHRGLVEKAVLKAVPEIAPKSRE